MSFRNKEGYDEPKATHTIMVLVFDIALVPVHLNKMCVVEEVFRAILSFPDLPSRVHEIADQYIPERLRYSRPKTPFYLKPNEIPHVGDIPNVHEIWSFPRTTWSCANKLPSDGSVVNLIIEEPLPFAEMPLLEGEDELANGYIFRSREVVRYFFSHNALVTPVSVPVLDGRLGQLDDPICCKVVRETEMSYFKTLEQLSADARHHIVGLALPPFQLPDGRYIIAMPDTGKSLDRIKGDQLSGDVIPHLILQLCDAVSFLHSNNIYHLDIKPENITISEDRSNTLTLIDLGSAMKGPGAGKGQGAVGTTGWVSPQMQLWHDYEDSSPEYKKTLSLPPCWKPRATDVWAVGNVIQYLLGKIDLVLDQKLEDLLLNVAGRLMEEEEANRPSIDEVMVSLAAELERSSKPSKPSLSTKCSTDTHHQLAHIPLVAKICLDNALFTNRNTLQYSM